MTVKNGYFTRQDFLNWVTPMDTSADAIDDSVIDSIIEGVSDYIEGETGRVFYPNIATNVYDLPEGRTLDLWDDLLEVITLTNGDDNTISSTYYVLEPANTYPKHSIKLKQSSIYSWLSSTSGDTEQIIDVNAFWGYREKYDLEGWKSQTTLGGALNDSSTSLTVASSTLLDRGRILKIGNEIMISDGYTSNTAVSVIARGDNGSTAAAHDNGSVVSIWEPEPSIVLAAKQIAQAVYRRFGIAAGDENIVTASGIVITPRDVPSTAQATILRYRNRL